MNHKVFLLLILLGLLILAVGFWALRPYFSASARLERRRRRSNARVTTDAKRPMVKFSVRTKNEK